MVKSDQRHQIKARYVDRVEGGAFEGCRVSRWIVMASHNAHFVLAQQPKGLQRGPDGRVAGFDNPGNPRKSDLVLPGVIRRDPAVHHLGGDVGSAAALLESLSWRLMGLRAEPRP